MLCDGLEDLPVSASSLRELRLVADLMNRFATLLYAPDSSIVTGRLWDETMKELEFAGPLRVLAGLKQAG